MAIDTLLTTPRRPGVKRIGDIGRSAPYCILRCQGMDMILQMPVLVQSRNTILWNQKDFTSGSSMGAAAIDAAKNVTDLSSAGKGSTEVATAALQGMVRKSATAAGSLIGIDNGADLVLHEQGKIVNSNKELTFEGMGYRNFVFEWEFLATNKDEAKSINDFIYYTQYYSSPGFDGGGSTYFTYPNQWEIFFEPSFYLPAIMPSFVTDYAINYGGVGKMVFHEEGVPVGVNIQITFTEAELHTKKKIQIEHFWG